VKKVELLSPVGNKEMLIQAVHNGADAVYLAGKNFGARKFASNFTNDELIDAVKYCHLYDVKTYITINTIIYENEINDFINYVRFLTRIGVDAVIMQDIGMINLVHKKFPNLEIHASTQAHNYNSSAVQFMKNLGVKRVVLARELSLEEIKNIDVNIEKEIFVYGALCVCYSGQCLFSSLNGGRSGNRGECVGSCRLPYKLIKDNQEIKLSGSYLLSMKELNTITHLKEILDSGVDSLKIEGRMKSDAYVGYVTRLYRSLIDKYYNNEPMIITDVELSNLKKIYNREFTSGFLMKDKFVSNIKTPNHQGIKIGQVIKCDKKYIYIKLTNDFLTQEDAIRFIESDKGMIVNKLYNKDNMLVNKVINNICIVDNKINLKTKDTVIKTIDKKLTEELNEINYKKIDISFDVECLLNKNLKITISDGINKITEYGDLIELSKNSEVTVDNIKKQLSKLGNTPFVLKNININKDDNIFINLSNLNQLRRKLTEQLIEIRQNKKTDILEQNYNITNINKLDKLSINILVRNEEQLKCALKYKLNNIYITDYELYKKYKHLDNIYYRLERIKKIKDTLINENLLITDTSDIINYQNNNLVGDYYFNVVNTHTINVLNDNNVKLVTLSVEIDDNNLKEILKKFNNIEYIVYGNIELMISKYCLLKENLNYCNQCRKSQQQYYLKNLKNNNYPVLTNNCITHIFDCKTLDKVDKIEEYYELGVRNFRIELFNEATEQIEKILNKIMFIFH